MIKCSNVVKRFDKRNLFDNYDLEINEGEFVCIYGASGSGKTTLLNMIGTLEKLDSGKIEFNIDGKVYNTKKNTMYIRSKVVNFIFQNYALIQKKTVLYNLMLALSDSKLSKQEKQEMISKKLEEVGIEDKINSFVYELSGGEMQRVAITRAMLKSGDVLLADEPTGSLDEENKRNIIELLQLAHSQGKTVIVVTHDNDFKDIATRVINL